MTDQEKYHFIIDSLIGGLDYPGVIHWMSLYPDIDSAYRAAVRLRSGQVAT